MKEISVQKRRKRKNADHFLQTRIDHLKRPAHIFTAENDLAGRIHIEKLRARILKNRTHALRRFRDRLREHILFSNGHTAHHISFIKMWNEPVDQPRDRRLSAAGTPTQKHHLARRNMKAHVLQTLRLLTVLVAKGHILKCNHDFLLTMKDRAQVPPSSR